MALLSSSGGTHALTSQGIQDAMSEHCEFDGHRPAVSGQRASIRAMIDALQRHDGPLTRQDLEDYYSPVNNGDPRKGRYGTHQYMQFWEDVATEQLAALPGTRETTDGFEFAGFDPADVDLADSRIRPIDDLRDHPRTKARNAADRLAEPGSDRHDRLMKLWTHVASEGETTSASIRSDVRRVDIEHLADDLEALPHIEREFVEPPEPADLEIDTYADVLEAEQAVDAEPETRWRYAN